MKKVIYSFLLFLTLLGTIIWSIPMGVFAPKHNNSNNNNQQLEINIPTSSILMNQSKTMEKKILMLIAFQNFRDEEYFIPKEIFEKNNYLVETVSRKTGIALGVNGNEAIVTKTPKDVNPKDYLALVICGGPGLIKELDNSSFQNLVKNFYKENKLVAAICAGPALLAKAGILTNKKATVWSSPLDKSLIKILKDNGALYEEQIVVNDENIITANGPEAAKEFGEKIVEVLNK
jgi:protease I